MHRRVRREPIRARKPRYRFPCWNEGSSAQGNPGLERRDCIAITYEIRVRGYIWAHLEHCSEDIAHEVAPGLEEILGANADLFGPQGPIRSAGPGANVESNADAIPLAPELDRRARSDGAAQRHRARYGTLKVADIRTQLSGLPDTLMRNRSWPMHGPCTGLICLDHARG